MSARGLRNKNPGNIRTGLPPWVGEVGNDGDFVIFDTDVHGIRAMAKNLITYQTKHGLRTISEMISRWAPPSENDTGAYIAAVCADVGVTANVPYPLTPERLLALVKAIIKHENGSDPYSDAVLSAGVDLAFGAQEPQPAPAPQPAPDTGRIVNPDQEAPMFPAFIVPALNALAAALPIFGPLFGTSEVATRNQKVGEAALGVAVQAIGAQNEQDMLAKVSTDKEAAAKAQAAIIAMPEISALMPLIDQLAKLDQARWSAEQQGRDAAAVRAHDDKWDMTPTLVRGGLVITAGMLGGLLFTLIWEAVHGDDLNAGLLGLTGPLLMAAIQCWKEIHAYRFDGSKTSEAQSATITQLAKGVRT